MIAFQSKLMSPPSCASGTSGISSEYGERRLQRARHLFNFAQDLVEEPLHIGANLGRVRDFRVVRDALHEGQERARAVDGRQSQVMEVQVKGREGPPVECDQSPVCASSRKSVRTYPLCASGRCFVGRTIRTNRATRVNFPVRAQVH